MESRAKLLGHSIHKMLIVFPLGLLTTAVVFDIVHLTRRHSEWAEAAYHMIPVGILGGLAAAVFGLIDWLAIPGSTRAKRVGAVHAVGNVIVLLLFAASWYLRRRHPSMPEPAAFALSFTGAVLTPVTAWLGGELANRLGVGVDDGAHLNAPSSLSRRPARDSVDVAGVRPPAARR